MQLIQQNVRYGRTLLAGAVVAMVAGCGSPQGREMVDVSGEVTLDGSPVEGASVTFHPLETSEGALACQAVTDADGRFRLTTHLGKGRFEHGIAPGHYDVVVTKLDTSAVSSTIAPPRNLLPKKYGNASTSGLAADVQIGKASEHNFHLKAE
jgi:hypothetical protein